MNWRHLQGHKECRITLKKINLKRIQVMSGKEEVLRLLPQLKHLGDARVSLEALHTIDNWPESAKK